jgi:hypothetical protein
MKKQEQLKKLIFQTRPHWDRLKTRPAVRSALAKALQCQTLELGAEVFASDDEKKVLAHTCKSRPCPSCGHRATVQWQRERFAALPNVPYKGITFTMPDVLWPLFRDNSQLTMALPALAASIIQIRVSTRSGLRVGVMAILHTFNGKLEFNSHVHTMVTAGGLYGVSDTWVSTVYYRPQELLTSWRRAVIKLLREALRAGQLNSTLTVEEIEAILSAQEKRWWSVKVQSFKSKEHFLKYAGRYLRRPPIAQRRITHVGERTVKFWYMDKKLGRRVEVQCSPEEFIERWSRHIPERYRHAVRNFGLFSPRAIRQTFDAIFAVLGQKRSPRPKPRPWKESIKLDFGRDPLLDSKGKPMMWVGRIAPRSAH